MNGEPPPTRTAIAPGTDEWLAIVYHPKTWCRTASAPIDSAEIHIDIGGEIDVIDIHDACVGYCSFPSPIAPTLTTTKSTFVLAPSLSTTTLSTTSYSTFTLAR